MTNAVPLKILIVDDHEAMRRTVKQLFAGRNMNFVEAASGEEALKVFAAEQPDWVVMDVRMPGMGGIRATRAIRQLDPQARIVAISQFTGPDCSKAALDAGALAFVNKEDLFQLRQIIEP